MKFDVSKLKQMNQLDFEQIAVWPFEVKTVVALFVAIITGVLGYHLLVSDKLPKLDKLELEEQDLKATYRAKYGMAVNLPAYEQQLADIREDFSAMLESLPTSNETPGLLDDITLVGTSAGLKFRLLSWQQEVPKEFYTELPIRMQVSGEYHEFGQFLSGIAALPRIVTIHDFDMEKASNDLTLTLQAQTYRTSSTEAQGAKP